MHRLWLASFIALISACNSGAPHHEIGSANDSVRVIRNDLNHPWEILWSKDNHIWMTERDGKISKLDPGTGKTIFSSSLPDVESRNEGGLLGMVQHPDFVTNGLFYVVYNYAEGGKYLEKMVQLKYADGAIKPVKTIIENIPAAKYHDGSRLWITTDSIPMLFMTTGDGFVQDNSQLLSSVSGKVLRFHLDGSIPSDNPFPGSAVWSFGHRNQQGLVIANGIMYASEHGGILEDELNIIEKGRNYGWPTVNGTCDQPEEMDFCKKHNIKESIWSTGNSTLAVCGLDYYNNDLISSWKNCLLMVTLKDASLRVFKLSADGRSVTGEQTFFKNRFGRLRDICISPAGKVYLCTSNGSNADVLVEISKP